MIRRLGLVIVLICLALPAAAGLRYAEATAPTSLNPMLVTDMPSLRATEIMYEGLVRPPIAGEVEPAEEARKSIDPKDVTVDVKGTRRQRALVMSKLGTIPEDEEVDLPDLE